MPLAASQVNITLLDINDNHPTWKDAPYYINLVEMTPPDSDVTTVSGGGGGRNRASRWLFKECLPLPREPYGPASVELFPSQLSEQSSGRSLAW